jgi:hypothetical protein
MAQPQEQQQRRRQRASGRFTQRKGVTTQVNPIKAPSWLWALFGEGNPRQQRQQTEKSREQNLLLGNPRDGFHLDRVQRTERRGEPGGRGLQAPEQAPDQEGVGCMQGSGTLIPADSSALYELLSPGAWSRNQMDYCTDRLADQRLGRYSDSNDESAGRVNGRRERLTSPAKTGPRISGQGKKRRGVSVKRKPPCLGGGELPRCRRCGEREAG